MRKLPTRLPALLLAFSLSLPALAAQEPAVLPALYAEAAILVDADTGQVLYQKNADRQMYPASITKIMTCLLAMEEAEPDEVVTITDEAVFAVPRDTTHIALTGGEELTAGQLEYAMMVESANDAANGLAVHLAGSLDAFAQRMNRKAAELGASDTHFVNANGLPDPRHYTSARDMALFTMAAFRHPEFRTLAGTTHYEIPPTNKQKDTRRLNNRNYMFTLNDTYPGAFAGKVGWTEESGHTLVTLAERDGVTLICIVLHSDGVIDAQYIDSTSLFDYGFGTFRRTAVPAGLVEEREAPCLSGGETVTAKLSLAGEMSVLLPAGTAPEDLGVRYDIPDPLEADGAASIALVLPGAPGTMDPVVGIFPLTVSLPEALPADAGAEIAPEALPRRGFLPWIGGVLLGAVLLLLAARALLRSYYRRRRRRKRRPPPSAPPRARTGNYAAARGKNDAPGRIGSIDAEDWK